MTFLKKHYKFILVCLAIIIIGGLANKIFIQEAEKIAIYTANQVMEKKYAQLEAVKNAYKANYIKLYKEKAKVDTELKDTGIKADTFATESEKRRKEILKLSDYKSQAIALNLQLKATNDFILQLKVEYTTNINDLDILWRKIVENKDNEIKAISDLYGALVVEHGKVVASYVKCQLRSRQRANLGFFAGYSVGGNFAAGFGITFDLVKIPIRVF